MFGKQIELFRLFGFPIKVDASWLIVAALVSWSLAGSFFPVRYPGFTTFDYWLMGVAGAVGLFAAIVVHECFHALVARRNGIAMRGITLFIFGGVAEMTGEPKAPMAELTMAAAGPFASILISLLCFALAALGQHVWPTPVLAVVRYLAVINLVLVGFNLLPAFPLDGGRIFRAVLWQWKHDLAWATRTAAKVGSGFGIGFMVLGVVSFVAGDIVSGVWWFIIALFLRQASTTSYRHVLVRRALEGESVSRFMTRQPITVPPDITIDTLVERYIYQHHHKLFPVAENGQLVGCVSTQQVKNIPRAEWARRTVASIAQRCGSDNAIAPEADAMDALARMQQSGQQRLLVVSDGQLQGIVTLKDLLGFLAVKMDLES